MLSYKDGLYLYKYGSLHEICFKAMDIKADIYGDNYKYISYIIERNINYTNICKTACRFCGFYLPNSSTKGAWTLTIDQLLEKCKETVELGGTQVMIQGGHNPTIKIEFYEELFSKIKKEFNSLRIHSLGGSEIYHISKVSSISIDETIVRLRDAGLDSLAGAGAEILPERPRKIIAPLKESGEEWINIMRRASKYGLEFTATLLFGTVETDEEIVMHLDMIRELQKDTNAVRAFIPYVYQPDNNILKGFRSTTTMDYIRLLAFSRIYLSNIKHIQGSWLTVGMDACNLSLECGIDDLGSIMLEENVVSSSGANNRLNLTSMIELIKIAGYTPIQRDTEYNHIESTVDVSSIRSHRYNNPTIKS